MTLLKNDHDRQLKLAVLVRKSVDLHFLGDSFQGSDQVAIPTNRDTRRCCC
jgi:hypothetical protein